jgi:hypothetical protein
MNKVTRLAVANAAVMLFGLAAVAFGQPSISSTSGTWSHQASVTIAGSGFGSKSAAAPTVWDNASGTNPLTKWDDLWPNCSGNSGFNLTYRTPTENGRNIGLPHNHITKYLAGAHYGPSPGPQCSYAVIMYKVRTITSFPAYSYASWYQRSDDGWHFGDDDNYKTFAYSEGVGPYNMPNNWYVEYNPRPTSRTSGAAWHINDDAAGTSTASLQSPDQNGHNWWWNDAVNPMAGQWSKVEMEIKYTNQNDGYIKLWENGVLQVDYRGKTDGLPGSTRTEGIGGYARNYPYQSNWRYFADVYLDYSRARVILGNASTYSASTIREVQIPTAWSGSSISLTVNLGKFQPGQTAYLYVVDSTGQANAAGVPITVGSGGGGGGGDTTNPTVSLTAPAAGATLTGSAAVSANASDNVGVVGVQFKLDGVNLGAEDMSAPYSISWDTTTTVNGSHTLTAVARDAAGNSATAAARTVTISNSAPPPPPPPIGLVAAYSFGEGSGTAVGDASGNSNNGVVAGNAAWTTQGRFGPALSLDGVDDLVTIPDAPSLDLTTGMTLEAWVNPTALSGWRTIMMKEINAGLAYALYANDNAPKPAAYVRLTNQSQSSGVGGMSQVPLNTWTHIAVTFDGGTERLFINGAEVSTVAASGSIIQSSNSLRIGGNGVWGEYFAGLIDEVRVYDRALTATEIQADMATPIAAPPHPPTNLHIVP